MCEIASDSGITVRDIYYSYPNLRSDLGYEMRTKQLISNIRQSLQHSRRMLQLYCYISLLACTVCSWALDSGDNTSAEWTPIVPLITPTYLEKAVNPLALNQDTGWQLGGFNTQFDSKTAGSTLSLRGGLFYSRLLGPRSIIDPNEPLPDNRFGQQVDDNGNARKLGVPQGFLFGNGSRNQTTDQIIYQQLNYSAHGLSLKGSYADVGKDFQGLGDLVKQMAPGDPTGVKMLTQGVSRTNFNIAYTGVRGLNFSNVMSREETNIAGDNYGRNATTQSTGLTYSLNSRQKLEFNQNHVIQSWDPRIVTKATNDINTTSWRFSQQLGAKDSQFSFGQTDTATLLGSTRTDVSQQQYGFSWNGWQNLHFNSSYLTKSTDQTHQLVKTLNMDLAATLLKNVQFTGKLVDGETTQPNAQPVPNDTLDLHLAAKLSPSLQFNSMYQAVNTPDKGQVTTQDQLLSWLISPKWKLTTHLLNTDNAATGQSNRIDYQLTGQIAATQQVSLFLRSDDLPNDVQQTRREIGYSQAFGPKKTPVALQMQFGQYGVSQPQQAQRDGNLLTMQLLSLHPLAHTTMSFGYYSGPTLGANYLTYRSWGLKPTANPDVWGAGDFVPYQEMGTEFTYALTGSTKLVMKQLIAERADTGSADMAEYGIEQQLGPARLMFGQRVTAQGTDKPSLQEQWWQMNLLAKKPLAAWAAGTIRQTVFADSTTWGLAQAPAWVTAPVAGFTLERQNVIVNGMLDNAWTGRYATMLGRRLFLQASYDQNPRKTDKPAEFDVLDRTCLHLAYQLQPSVITYLRFANERRFDLQPSIGTNSLGLIGTFSHNQKLHLQADLLERGTTSGKDYGLGYMVGYERTVNPQDTMMLKYRCLPIEFSTPDTNVHLEGTYQHAF